MDYFKRFVLLEMETIQEDDMSFYQRLRKVTSLFICHLPRM